jgi:hypothetical protein
MAASARQVAIGWADKESTYGPRLFIGGHTELARPVYRPDERLMRRIEEARRRLGSTQVKSVRLNRLRSAAGSVSH